MYKRQHNDGTLEITAGQKEKAVQSKAGQAIVIETEYGKFDIIVKNNALNIKATNILIQAEDTLALEGNKIRIGRSEKGATSDIDFIGNRIHFHNPRDGNMAILLRTHNMFGAFAGSFVGVNKIAARFGVGI